MKESKLTGQTFWEDYWEGKPGKRGWKKINMARKELFKTFDQFLPATKGLTILEIGGAKGEFLLYFARHFEYKAYSLDYSRVGNEQTLETFSNARLPVEVFERDLFGDNSDLPKFDIVYSLGLIEHFDDPGSVVEKHLDFLNPGGILLLGVPNYSGIYHVVLHRLAPSIEKTHNLKIMDISEWRIFEQKLRLKTVFSGYICGFEPLNMKKLEVRNLLNHILYFFIRVLMVLLSFNFQFLRRFNSKFWSCYLLGIYRKGQ